MKKMLLTFFTLVLASQINAQELSSNVSDREQSKIVLLNDKNAYSTIEVFSKDMYDNLLTWSDEDINSKFLNAFAKDEIKKFQINRSKVNSFLIEVRSVKREEIIQSLFGMSPKENGID